MSPEKETNRAEAVSWQADRLRLSAFPAPPGDVQPGTWWEDLLGERPDRQVNEPKRGTSLTEGPYGSGRLVLSVQPLRVDWVYSASEQDDVPEHVGVSLGPYGEALDTFARLMNRWLPMAPPLQRLAVGAVLRQPVPDRRTGYEKLQSFLPSVKLDSEHSSDFFYQINRPRPSRSNLPGLVINRLSKWSVGAKQLGTLSLTPQRTSYRVAQEVFGCVLELDINTSPDFPGVLPGQLLGAIVGELIDISIEITQHGDRP